MACNLTQGFLTDCLEGIGGVKELFLVNWENVNGGITFDGTTGEIDDLPTATLYRYVPLRNSGVWGEVPTPSRENGTLFYAQSVAFRIGALSAAKRKEFNLLARAKVAIFVRLASDKIVMAGRQNGMFLDTSNWGSGAAAGDFSGYEFTFVSEEPLPAEYTEAYTSQPFDNYPDITVTPAYSIVS